MPESPFHLSQEGYYCGFHSFGRRDRRASSSIWRCSTTQGCEILGEGEKESKEYALFQIYRGNLSLHRSRLQIFSCSCDMQSREGAQSEESTRGSERCGVQVRGPDCDKENGHDESLSKGCVWEVHQSHVRVFPCVVPYCVCWQTKSSTKETIPKGKT